MRIRKAFMFWLIVCTVLLLAPDLFASDEPICGLVVDRSDEALWLGLPAAVEQGTVFDVSLIPGGRIIAQARVEECTPDSPYVAKAEFKMLDASAFVPIGAYVETVSEVVSERDAPDGYRAGKSESGQPNPFDFQAGIFFPTASGLKDETDWGWPFFQVGYRLSDSPRGDVNLGLGYYHQDGSFTIGSDEGSRDFRVLPLTLDVKVRSSESPGRSWFWRVGIGAYMVDDERTFGGVTDSDSVTTFGWQGGIGYESRSGRFAQLCYVDVSKSDFKGLTFSLGARF